MRQTCRYLNKISKSPFLKWGAPNSRVRQTFGATYGNNFTKSNNIFPLRLQDLPYTPIKLRRDHHHFEKMHRSMREILWSKNPNGKRTELTIKPITPSASYHPQIPKTPVSPHFTSKITKTSKLSKTLGTPRQLDDPNPPFPISRPTRKKPSPALLSPRREGTHAPRVRWAERERARRAVHP